MSTNKWHRDCGLTEEEFALKEIVDKIKNSSTLDGVRLLQKISGQSSLTPKSIRDSDAVEFAKFILKDYEIVSLKKSEDVEEYYYWQLAGTYQTYTTEELYGDFNKLTSLKPNKLSDNFYGMSDKDFLDMQKDNPKQPDR